VKKLAVVAVPVAVLILAGCVSQSAYDQLQAENEQLKAQLAQQQTQ
jgi:outer membrane murein-binding lipoprotein Lpp